MKNSIKAVFLIGFSLLSSIVLAESDTTTTTSTSTLNSSSNTDNNNQTTMQSTVTTKTSPNTPSDEDNHITSLIYDKFARDAAMIGTTITVMTLKGVVTLNGAVTAQSQADEAVIVAKSISGVKDVRSSINVTTNPGVKKISRPNY